MRSEHREHMTYINKNGHVIAVVNPDVNIDGTQELLDLFATAWYDGGSDRLIVYKESLSEDFFDLKTGVAGELLQKCSNYRMHFAIVGDFSHYTSKSLRNFIYESNKGRLIFYTGNLASAVAAQVKDG